MDYYATLFHELTHWTGHSSRLNRATLAQMGRFGDANYSREELVAEMGAGFPCALTGIENAVLDRNGQAQAAADYLTRHWKPAPVAMVDEAEVEA